MGFLYYDRNRDDTDKGGVQTKDTILFGKYRIDQILGTGRSGTVFLATHLGLEEPRAIKRVAKTAADHEQFRREALLLKGIRHPGIPIVYDLEEDSQYSYIIEEYLDGETLYDLVTRQGHLTKTKLLQYGVKICHLVHYLHSMKPIPILYLDLQPRNLLVCGSDIKLIDFDHAASKLKANQDSKRYGTIGCAAPEQYLPDETLDERTDLYAIGVVLHYLGTGTYPSADAADVDIRSFEERFGGKLGSVVRNCLYQKKEQRYSSVSEAAEKLEQLLAVENGAVSSRKIAVVSSHHGGATHMAIGLSVYLERQGVPYICEEKNLSGDLLAMGRNMGLKTDRLGCFVCRNVHIRPGYGEQVVLETEESDAVCGTIVRDYGTDWEAARDWGADGILLVCGDKPWEQQENARAVASFDGSMGLRLLYHHTSRRFAVQKPEGVPPEQCFRVPYFPDPWEQGQDVWAFFQAVLQSLDMTETGRRGGGIIRRIARRIKRYLEESQEL